MPYSITCFTKILTLAKPPLLLILVGVYCEFAMVPGVYIYCPLKKKRSNFYPEGTDVHIQQYIHQKDLNLYLPLYYYGQVIVELDKAETLKSTAFMVLII